MGTIDTQGWVMSCSVFGGGHAVPCSVGHLAAPLASIHYQPVAIP